MIWEPPAQPSSADIVASDTDLSAFEALWDGLVAAHPGYITRTSLGKDSTGTNDVWKYVFEPPAYEKTVLLTATVHGTETLGQKALYRFLYHVCNNSGTYPQLAYLRHKVRIVVLPIANPSGLVAGIRYNSNGVDINRNFAYGWTSLVDSHKGASVLSEVEAQYIDALMAASGAVACLDIHNTGVPSPDAGTVKFYVSAPPYADSARNVIHGLIDAVTPSGFTSDRLIESVPIPACSHQAANIYHMHAMTVEWMPGGRYGVTAFSADDMRDAVRFIGNAVLQFAALNPQAYTRIAEPFAIEHANNTTTWQTASTNVWEEVPGVAITFTPPCDGLLFIASELAFQNTTAASVNFMVPVVLQAGHYVNTPSGIATQQAYFHVYTEPGGKRASLAASRVVSVNGPSSNGGDVTVAMYVQTDAGVLLHRRSRLHVMFLPVDGGNRYKLQYWDGSTFVQFFPPPVI
jgi:predicted deacylase